jgi:hypothetical protein
MNDTPTDVRRARSAGRFRSRHLAGATLAAGARGGAPRAWAGAALALTALPGAGLPLLRGAGTAAGTTAAAPAGNLTVAARVDLGPFSTTSLDSTPSAEAPGGTFYFAAGSAIEVVTAAGAPRLLVHARAKVLALAVTGGELYAQVGLDVLAYSLPALVVKRTWSLTPNRLAPRSAPTSAGLLAGGGAVWCWDDWATDQSGFEYATLDELSGAGVTRLVDREAYPADMAVDSTGLYYETEVGSKGHLAHVTAGGTKELSKPTSDTDAPMVLSGGSVFLLAVHEPSGTPYLDRFAEASLALRASVREQRQLVDAVDTSAGVLAVVCSTASCARVARLDLEDATTSGGVAVPGVAVIVQGTDPAVLAVSGGRGWLVRLASAPATARSSRDAPQARAAPARHKRNLGEVLPELARRSLRVRH